MQSGERLADAALARVEQMVVAEVEDIHPRPAQCLRRLRRAGEGEVLRGVKPLGPRLERVVVGVRDEGGLRFTAVMSALPSRGATPRSSA